MSEKRKILDLDISTDEILKKSTELRKELDKLRKTRKEVQKQDGDNAQELAKLDAGISKLSSEYRTNQKALSQLIGDNQELLTTQEKLEQSLNKEITSINSARESNKELLAIRNELNLSTEEGQRNAEIINQKLDENNEFIKENVSQLEQQKIGIGGYKDAINEAIKENDLLNGTVGKTKETFSTFIPIIGVLKNDFGGITEEYRDNTKATEGMTTAQVVYQKANAGTVAGLKLLRLALIGIGIGAILFALGSLVAFLSSTQEGIDKVNRVLTPTKEIFSALFGLFQDAGKALFDAFMNPKKTIKDFGNLIKDQVVNRFQAVISILRRIRDFDFDGIGEDISKAFTGVENAGEKIRNFARDTKNFFNETIERGNEIQKLNEQIERREATIKLETDRLQRQIDLVRERRKDDSLSAAERRKAGEEEIRLTTEQRKAESDLLDLKIERLRLQQQVNDTTIKDEKELNDLIGERERVEAQLAKDRTSIRTTINSQERAIERERLEAINKENEARINNLNLELRLFIANNQQKNKTEQEQLAFAEELKNRRLAILEEELKTGQKLELEYQAEKQEILNDFGDKQVDISLKLLDREIEIQKQRIEQEIINEEEKFNRLAELDKEYARQKLERGIINEEQFNQAIEEVNNENRERLAELEAERDEIDKQNRIETERLNFEQFKERRLQELNEQRALELAEAERLGADKALITKKFNQLEAELNQQLFEQQLALTAQTVGDIASILGDQSKAGKAFALAQATLNTFEGITRALTLPFPANLAAAATTSATGFAAVRNIMSTNIPSFARGGILDDPSLPGTGTSDSIPARLSKGESVINAKSTKMFAPILSKINQAGGGVAFAQGGVAGVSRVVNQISKESMDFDKLADRIGEKVVEGNKSLPSQTLIIEEFEGKKDMGVKIKDRANHG